MPEFQASAGKLFKRINEAFFVLRDDARRAQYLADINGPDRAQKLRYSEESESQKQAQKRKTLLEMNGLTPQGRKCYQMAAKEMDAGRWAEAVRQLKMALLYEPQNEQFKARLAECEAQLKGG